MGDAQMHDAWVKQVFGVEIAPHVMGKHHGPSPEDQFRAHNKAALAAIDTAVNRPLAPADAKLQDDIGPIMAAMDQALKNGNIKVATAKLGEALKQAKLVMAAKDPATMAPKLGVIPNQTLFGKEDGDANEISENDIHQEQIGDCYLLSSIGEIAKVNPTFIKKMIRDNGNGTYTVTLHRKEKQHGILMGKSATGFEPVQVTVDGIQDSHTVNSDAANAQVKTPGGPKKEIWVQVIEKAYAKLNGGYDKITDGGNPADAMQTLTGRAATSKPIKDVSLAELEKDLADGKLLTMDTKDTKGKKMPFGLYDDHAYMVEKIETRKDGKKFVRLKNPWGKDDPDPIPFEQLGKAIETMEAGRAP